MQDHSFPAIKLCKVPKIFFEPLEKERLKEMREGVVNALHAMDKSTMLNLLKGRPGGLTYFVALPRKQQALEASVIAQFKRWDIIAEQAEFSPRAIFGPEDTAAVVLTFAVRQYFWDRMKYTQVQVPNFFEALVATQQAAWVQIGLKPVSEKRVKRPLDNLYRRDLGRLGRKDRHKYTPVGGLAAIMRFLPKAITKFCKTVLMTPCRYLPNLPAVRRKKTASFQMIYKMRFYGHGIIREESGTTSMQKPNRITATTRQYEDFK